MHYIPYSQIPSTFESLNRKEQYQLLLQTIEWKNFRDSIITRDNNKCTKCGKENDGYPVFEIPHDEWLQLCQEAKEQGKKEWRLVPSGDDDLELVEIQYVPPKYKIESLVILEVHHKLYIYNHLPWEYHKKHLTSLCPSCHKHIHENETIFTYRDNSLTFKKATHLCSKCNGTGYLSEYEYYKDGVCFDCGGQGVLLNEHEEWK